MRFYVYELRDHLGSVFYVGKGQRKRMHDHLKEARTGKHSHKCNKIRSLIKAGFTPVPVKVFQTDSEEEAHAEERRLIALYGRASLTNCTDGGEGVCGLVHSAETRRKLSESSKRRPPPSAETLKRRSEALKGIKRGPISAQHREKLRQAHKGKMIPPEVREKIAAAHRGQSHPWAVNSGKNLGSGFAGRSWSPQHREKFKQARKGHAVTEKTRAKISNSKKGTPAWNKGLTAYEQLIRRLLS